MIRLALFGAALVSAPLAAIAVDRVCAPDSMIKVVAALDVPGAPSDHFVRVPKTLYRYGERYGRVEEAPNPVTGTHLLVVVAEPDVWIADLAGRRGNYEKDPGPTYYFRARIFGDPSIRSSFINTLEFGCEREWLLKAGAKLTKRSHPELGSVDEIRYSEGTETVILFTKDRIPQRIEFNRDGKLYLGVQYHNYTSGLRFDPSLFARPSDITFVGEASK